MITEVLCSAPGCTAVASGQLCIAHKSRLKRGVELEPPVATRRYIGVCLTCQERQATIGERCKRCYSRCWRQGRKTAGLSYRVADSNSEWFDWEVIRRAWNGEVPGRPLTNAERLHLLYLAVQQGGWSADRMGRLAGLEAKTALRLAERIASGEVQVFDRDWQGNPLQALSAPVLRT